MIYKYFQSQNYEDFAGGRIIYHKAGYTNYPVRLAGEIFMRSLEASGKQGNICLYDPCCGSGYMLTVLGFLCGKHISSIIGSDISNDVLALASKNLSLLTKEGLLLRNSELTELYSKYGKESHLDAISSVTNLQKIIDENKTIINHSLFQADILTSPLENVTFKADIVITDVPYGQLAAWQATMKQPPVHGGSAVNRLLDSLIPALNTGAIVAVSSDKQQKVSHDNFIRINKLQVGKRRIELIKYVNPLF